jgi:Fe-coproporphyrin III synthase
MNSLVVIEKNEPTFSRHAVSSLPILILHAHTSCNCRCVMCDIWKNRESRSFSPVDLERMLPAMRRLQVKWIVLSGGEPLLNPEWPVLCRILKKEGIRVTLLTSGLLLENCASRIVDVVDEVIVSLDGPARIHDLIRQIASGFALIERGIAAIRRLTPEFRITARSTVQKLNYLHLRETVKTAKNLNLNGISFLAADLTSQAFNRPVPWTERRQQDIGLTQRELFGLEEEIELLIRDHTEEIACGFVAESPEKLRRIASRFRESLALARPESPVCNAPWTSAVIETDGTVRPCFFHQPVGTIRNGDLEKVVNGRAAISFRSSLDLASNPICNRCVCSLNYRGANNSCLDV